MGIVDLQHEIGDRELQLVHPQPSRLGPGRKGVAPAEIEQDVGGLPDHELAGFQERRRKGRRFLARLHYPHHRIRAALAARDIVVIGAGVLQRETHIFATALDEGPVIELVAHG